MTDRLLYPFEPEMPWDGAKVADFNALTYSAWGMREKRLQMSNEREWQIYEIHNGGTEPYFGSIDGNHVDVAARIRFRKFGREMELLTLAVDRGQQRKKLGSRAIAELVDAAVDRDANVVKVDALPVAADFYKQHGFVETSRSQQIVYMHLDL